MATLQRSPSKVKSSEETAGTPIYTNSAPSSFDRIAPSPFPIDELQSFQLSSSQSVPLDSTSTDTQLAETIRTSSDQTIGSPPDYAFHSSQDDLSLSEKSIPPGYDDQSPTTTYTASPKHKSPGSSAKQFPYDTDQENKSDMKDLGLDPVSREIIDPPSVNSRVDDQRADAKYSKLEEMDLAKMIGRGRMDNQSSEFPVSKGKKKSLTNEQQDGEVKNKELMDIWEKIERAHGTRLNDQSFAPMGDQPMEARPEPPSWQAHSDSPSFCRDPSEMITAGQFIQENMSRSVSPATRSSPRTVGCSTERPLLVKSNSVSSKIAGMFGRKESSPV